MVGRSLPTAVLAALVAGAILAGCGDPQGDLFAVERAGSIPGARLRLVVNDGGTVRCDDAQAVALPADLLIDARELERELEEPAADGVSLPPRPESILRYRVLTAGGNVRFADNSRPTRPVFQRMAFFVRKVAKGVCGLPR